MRVNVLSSPAKYVQGRDVIKDIGKYLEPFSDNILFLVDSFVYTFIKDEVLEGAEGSNVTIHFEIFGGESTDAESDRVVALAKEKNCGAVVGCGGGKTIDCAKAAGAKGDMPFIVIPTAASTDAPCSALSVVYSEKGEWLKDFFLPHNPNLVLVDTQVIANAPTRMLVAGIGDAFATYYEARACRAADVDNFVGGKSTNAAYALAKLSNEILLEDGYYAVQAVENNVVTQALENVVEANIYLSGVGFESNGCSVCHGFYGGMTHLARKEKYLHGECVAFGTLVQLIVENVPSAELDSVYDFFEKVGLPTTLEDLQAELSQEDIDFVAKAMEEDIPISLNVPFSVDRYIFRDAIMMADFIGRSRK